MNNVPEYAGLDHGWNGQYLAVQTGAEPGVTALAAAYDGLILARDADADRVEHWASVLRVLT